MGAADGTGPKNAGIGGTGDTSADVGTGPSNANVWGGGAGTTTGAGNANSGSRTNRNTP